MSFARASRQSDARDGEGLNSGNIFPCRQLYFCLPVCSPDNSGMCSLTILPIRVDTSQVELIINWSTSHLKVYRSLGTAPRADDYLFPFYFRRMNMASILSPHLRLHTLLQCIPVFATLATAVLKATETSDQLVLSNDRFHAAVNKSSGVVDKLSLDDQNLLGDLNFETPTPGGATGSGNSGIGPYLDCYCVPEGSYTPGSIDPKFKLIKGVDSANVPYGGIVMSETYASTGQILEQYLFLRENETGLHSFSRLAYYNQTTPFLRNLQEFRTLFRPNTPLWTHMLANSELHAPLPSAKGTEEEITVQDATWYLGNTPDDPYVEQFSDYFTKYTFADTWRDHDVHGMYSDGSTSDDNSTFGAWFVMNTKDTYFGGPLHSDLIVDGIVYNYLGMCYLPQSATCGLLPATI